ncbi:MAG TPA: M48 family metalloprotease [Candidatus Sulfotelmatobacter sp.]|nr:M48 family metalloprotease [Candidatus Sulfotelmatobacter sp.]
MGILLVPSMMMGRPASDAAEPPTVPNVEAPKPENLKESKKNQKYDIDHIGQRGIGHGFNLYSVKREFELGRNMAAGFDRSTKAIHDDAVNAYVNRLAQKIVRYSDADIPFTVKVIDSGDIPRAYGLPGGFLYVDSALILSADDEAELAAVMAHEIAHVAARHATRAMTRRDVCRIIDSLAYVAGPAGAGAADIGGLAGPLSVKKFSRDAEYEADLLGIEYAYAAGYDPQALLDALEKLHAIEEHRKAELAKIPGYHLATRIPFHSKIAKSFANYPLTEERIGRLESAMAEFLPGRKDYILDTDEFQEMKARLLASQMPTLRHHAAQGDEDSKGPVLRRHPENDSDVLSPSNVAPLRERTVNTSFLDIPATSY